MKTHPTDSDLLFHALGELPYWRSWAVSRHLASCANCSAAQSKLSAVSGHLASALQAPGSGVRLPKPPVTVVRGWFMVASLALIVLVASLLVYTAGTNGGWWHSPASTARPCKPGLPNDKCQ